MKQVCFLLWVFFTPVLLFAQRGAPGVPRADSVHITDTPGISSADSFLNVESHSIVAIPDTAIRQEIIMRRRQAYQDTWQRLLADNQLLNSRGSPVALENKARVEQQKDNFFYVLALVGLLLGIFRFFYTRYFNNLFRVFFNASLRQSQLTDQLLQAKVPSLFFNILFILCGGIYVYLLLRYYRWVSALNFWPVLFYCTVSLAFIYMVKLITVKFTGWVTGNENVTKVYVFIIFLINKILGVLLLPFAIIIAFAAPPLATAAVSISLLLIGLMFMLRFLRSYGLLQHQLKISRFHFFLYVAGIEILPVLLIYKGLVLLLSKNL